MVNNEQSLRTRIKVLLVFFIGALLISGVTAFPLLKELEILDRLLGKGTQLGTAFPGLGHWLSLVRTGLTETYDKYPFIAYGTDWLAFAHIAIAIAFIGPLRDPVRNIWVIEFGMISCILVIPLALICGQVRGIPIIWRLIDCSFGIVGIVPLLLIRRYTLQLAAMKAVEENAGNL